MCTAKSNLIQELDRTQQKIRGPHPYQDMRNMRNDALLAPFFSKLAESAILSADFSTYWDVVDGTASFIIKGKIAEIPKRQIEWLMQGDFFAIFPQYAFLKSDWNRFPSFAYQYTHIKKMQDLILLILSSSP